MIGFSNIKFLCFFLMSAGLMITASCKQKVAKTQITTVSENKQLYTCSMHPQIIRDKPGKCPICGMDLIKKDENAQRINDIQLEDLLKPTNEFIISKVPVTTIKRSSEVIDIEALGTVENDTRQLATISSKISGRIEKLYVRYRYQMVMPGDKIMDIYSPEIATAQQNLLFLLKADATNISLIQSAKQKLLLMGMSTGQLQQLVRSGKASLTMSVYSNAMGHIHEAGQETMNTVSQVQNNAPPQMQNNYTSTAPLSVREGMYVQLGQKVFSLTNPRKASVILNIFPENQRYVRVGNRVKVTPEAMPEKSFGSEISFIEPFYRQGSKTLTARVYFNNTGLAIPIGSQVRANIFGNNTLANWLPQDAVLSLGLEYIVFVKTNGGFEARGIKTGIKQNNLVQIISGLSVIDSVAANAQYLTDSESFIKIKK